MPDLNASEMPKLRILGVSTSYPLRHDSTAGLFVHRLYHELSPTFEVIVVCPADSTDGYDRENHSVVVSPVKYAPRRLRVLGGAGGIIPAIRSAQWKVLLLPALLSGMFISVLKHGRSVGLIHANWAICGMLAGLAGRLLRKPVVTTLRGDDVSRASHSMLDRFFLSCAVRWSQKIVCVSEPMAERLSLAFPQRASDIHACLNGVDESFFSVVKRDLSGSLTLRIVCVGSLIPRKAYATLVRAVALCGARKEIHVKLIGEGPSRGELESLCRSLGVAGQFEFLGERSPEQIRQVFAESDLFALPSRSEGRPNALIEAIAAGLPAISTDLDGVRGLVFPELNGWLFAVDDANGLAEMLDSAFRRKPDLSAMGERGRDALSTWGGWERTACCYSHVFNAALGSEVSR